jgi:CubicO group peptidase (beta-lactamase class C family)
MIHSKSVTGICLSICLPICIWAFDLTGASNASRKPPAPGADRLADLQTAIPNLMKDADVPGLSIAIIRDAEIIWQHGFGVLNAEIRQPVGDDTVFEAASLSKPVFAYAVLKMVDGRTLDLDTPLTKYLPDAYVENDDRLNLITARRVLSHTTGFPNWRPAGQSLKIHFTPGEKFSYSGEGFVYLQKAVEHVTGMPLDAFMKKTVFEPLGMASSSYVWQERYERLKAFGHNGSGAVAGRNKPTTANAAATLQTTAGDYARFVIAILKGEGLKKETLSRMLTPQVKLDESCVTCFDRPPGKLSSALSWGLGWGLQHNEDGDCFWHWGDNGPMKAFVLGMKEKKIGLVLFTNGDNGLSIAPEIVKRAIGGNQPVFAWINYEAYDSPARKLYKDIVARGEQAITDYKERREAGALNESRMNRIGYQLLQAKKVKEAIEVFKLNVGDFPDSFNACDSLAEAYLTNGDKQLAIRYYRKSLELNPQNQNAVRMLKTIDGQQAKSDPNAYDVYAGQYEAAFGLLTITREGDKLYGQVAGEKSILVPGVENKFFVPEADNAQLTFVKDETGRVTEIIIVMNGEESRAKKVK